jgi:citrate synthase
MLETIKADGGDSQKYIDKAKIERPVPVNGIGHRVLKTDHGLKIIK